MHINVRWYSPDWILDKYNFKFIVLCTLELHYPLSFQKESKFVISQTGTTLHTSPAAAADGKSGSISEGLKKTFRILDKNPTSQERVL